MKPRSLGLQREIPLPIAKVLSNPRQDWYRIAKKSGRTASTNIDWNKYNPDDFLFSQATIVSSVDVEKDGHTIKPSSSHIVNNNGNAWTNAVLLATFRSFIGGQNFEEHVQILSQSRGKILDAVIRPFRYKQGDDVSNVYICDILVATDRKHARLCQDIERGKIKTMSMGLTAMKVQCSKCGKIFTDEDEECEHLKNELLKEYVDDNGVKRVVAELCGISNWNPKTQQWEGDPESQQFIEASWVAIPAFVGAEINHFVEPKDVGDKFENMFGRSLERAFSNRVASKEAKIALRIAKEAERIAKRDDMVNSIIKTASDYIHDPDHKKSPPAGYHKTEEGWSNTDESDEWTDEQHRAMTDKRYKHVSDPKVMNQWRK